jgi:hypothetical protein
MSSALPYWIQVLQALLTPAIALLAVVIGVLQWRISQQRVMLDLFEKRWAKYTVFRDAVVLARISEGVGITDDTRYQFRIALEGVEFIFGDEIIEPLNEINEALAELSSVVHVLQEFRKERAPNESYIEALMKKQRDQITIVENSYRRFHTYLKPYMRMDHKSTWRPWG